MSESRATRGWAKLVVVSLLAFGFTFSLVPLYRIACEKVFGVRMTQGPGDAGAAAVAHDRVITVEFDGGVNSKLDWEFRPSVTRMQVHPGQQYETTYFAHNRTDSAVVGSAVPSVAPARGSAYFIKTECFCFTAQTMQPGESRDMPVRFIVDPDLPADISTITLSYTFFRNDALTARLDTPAATPAATAR